MNKSALIQVGTKYFLQRKNGDPMTVVTELQRIIALARNKCNQNESIPLFDAICEILQKQDYLSRGNEKDSSDYFYSINEEGTTLVRNPYPFMVKCFVISGKIHIIDGEFQASYTDFKDYIDYCLWSKARIDKRIEELHKQGWNPFVQATA